MNDAVKEFQEQDSKQKHYYSESEIIAYIDEVSREMGVAEKAGLMAQKLEAHYMKLSRATQNGESQLNEFKAGQQKKLAGQFIRKAERLEKKLKQFKRTLAAFKTQDMFGTEPVVLQD